MIKEQVLNTLKGHQEDFKRFKVKAIYLFGSVARGEEGPQSDIDILVAFDGPCTFDQYMDLKFYLENLLLRKIDLVTEAALRPELRNTVFEDLIRAA